MSCEICGRNSCTRSFHSIEEQDNFDNVADGVKDTMRDKLIYKINRIDGHYHGNNYYVPLDKVFKIIQEY